MCEEGTCCGSSVYSQVKQYYGQTIKTAEDLATGVCTYDRKALSQLVRDVFGLIHPEIREK